MDLEKGSILWKSTLGTWDHSLSLPMSYEVNGKQYVVVAAGGHAFIYPKPEDLIRAYALPGTVKNR